MLALRSRKQYNVTSKTTFTVYPIKAANKLPNTRTIPHNFVPPAKQSKVVKFIDSHWQVFTIPPASS